MAARRTLKNDDHDVDGVFVGDLKIFGWGTMGWILRKPEKLSKSQIGKTLTTHKNRSEHFLQKYLGANFEEKKPKSQVVFTVMFKSFRPP